MTTFATHDHDDDHDRGLSHDLPRLLSRRGALGLLGAMSLATIAGVSPAFAASGEIPEETAGPFPADGSNGKNVLNQSGVVRSNIRPSFGSSTTVAKGIPLTLTMRIVDFSNDSKPLKGAAVYLWHCDRDGNYSMYSPAVVDENYLRGVQVADANGLLTFRTIFPGCYSGRWPHTHFEVYPTLRSALSASSRLSTSQLALPESTSKAVYATTGYSASARNLSSTSLSSDMVFSDGYRVQMPKVTGSNASGYRATITVPV